MLSNDAAYWFYIAAGKQAALECNSEFEMCNSELKGKGGPPSVRPLRNRKDKEVLLDYEAAINDECGIITDKHGNYVGVKYKKTMHN